MFFFSSYKLKTQNWRSKHEGKIVRLFFWLLWSFVTFSIHSSSAHFCFHCWEVFTHQFQLGQKQGDEGGWLLLPLYPISLLMSAVRTNIWQNSSAYWSENINIAQTELIKAKDLVWEWKDSGWDFSLPRLCVFVPFKHFYCQIGNQK